MKKITLILSIIIIFASTCFAQGNISVKIIKQLESECSNNDFLSCFFAGQLLQDTGLMISAVTAYKKACDNKIYEACLNLGKIYKNDYNKTMQKEAVKLFNTACDESIASGCFELAYLYYKGDITRKSLSKARKLFDKACSMQNAPSCYNAGIIYQQGLKVKKNTKKAMEYFKKSCSLNFDKGCLEYEKLLNNLTDTLKDK